MNTDQKENSNKIWNTGQKEKSTNANADPRNWDKLLHTFKVQLVSHIFYFSLNKSVLSPWCQISRMSGIFLLSPSLKHSEGLGEGWGNSDILTWRRKILKLDGSTATSAFHHYLVLGLHRYLGLLLTWVPREITLDLHGNMILLPQECFWPRTSWVPRITAEYLAFPCTAIPARTSPISQHCHSGSRFSLLGNQSYCLLSFPGIHYFFPP